MVINCIYILFRFHVTEMLHSNIISTYRLFLKEWPLGRQLKLPSPTPDNSGSHVTNKEVKITHIGKTKSRK